MNKRKRNLVIVLCAVLAAAAGIAGGYFVSVRTEQNTESRDNITIQNYFTESWTYLASADGGIAAAEDYTGNVQNDKTVNGVLYVPDNITVTNTPSASISVRGIRFDLPGCWVGNTTLRTIYYDNAGVSVRYNTLGFDHDTAEIRFYDADAYSGAHQGTDASLAENGLLASIYIVNIDENDLSGVRNAAVRAATLVSGDSIYAVFITPPSVPDDVPGSTYER